MAKYHCGMQITKKMIVSSPLKNDTWIIIVDLFLYNNTYKVNYIKIVKNKQK